MSRSRLERAWQKSGRPVGVSGPNALMGEKAAFINRLRLAIERSPALRMIAANGGGPQWSASGVAVANAPGELPFESGLFADSRLVLCRDGEQGVSQPAAGRPITVRAIDLFSEDHDVELLKMDIEGGE